MAILRTFNSDCANIVNIITCRLNTVITNNQREYSQIKTFSMQPFRGQSKMSTHTNSTRLFNSDDPESPNSSRKIYSQSTMRVTQNEVEEKLKAMRLKRLSRLNNSVSGERQTAREDDVTEEAASSRGSSPDTASKEIVEEDDGTRDHLEDSNVNLKEPSVIMQEHSKIELSETKSSSKKSFRIFNCIGQPDKTSDVYEKQDDQSHIKGRNNAPLAANTFHTETPIHSIEYEQINTNFLEKPNGKHRKTIYYGENEQLPSDLTPALVHDQALSLEKFTPEENEVKSPSCMTNVEGAEIPRSKKEIFVKKKYTIGVKSNNSADDIQNPPLSAVLSPRKRTLEDKTLKKLQRNWNSLKEILTKDSDVDLDELEDMKSSLEQADGLLVEYREKLKTLEEKIIPLVSAKRKLTDLQHELDKVSNDLGRFNGLKRDLRYIQLSNKLSNIFLEINNICNKFGLFREKKELIAQVDGYIKKLEAKVARNEALLFDILREQVDFIGRNHPKTIKY